MLERTLLAALLLGLAAAGLFLLRRQSPLHLLTLALIATALVGSFHPVLTIWIEPSSWREASFAPEHRVLAVQADYAAFAAGILAIAVATWLAGGLRSSRGSLGPSRSVRRRDACVAWGLLLSGGVLYAAYVATVGFGPLLDREDQASKYLHSTGLGPLAAGLVLMITGCLWAEGGEVSARHKAIFRCAGAALGVWSLWFLSIRTSFVMLVAGYAWIACVRNGLELRRVRISWVAALVALYAVLETFSLFRGAWEGDVAQAMRVIVADPSSSLSSAVGGSELSHPFLTALEVEESEEAGALAGASFLRALPALAPRFVFPDRPPTLSEDFVRTNYADLAEQGGGTGFSLAAEAWWNFGPILGPFLVGAALAAMLAWIEAARRSAPDGIVARLAPTFAYLVVIAHRCESAALLKQIVLVVVPALLLAWSAGAWTAGARRDRAARAAAESEGA